MEETKGTLGKLPKLRLRSLLPSLGSSGSNNSSTSTLPLREDGNEILAKLQQARVEEEESEEEEEEAKTTTDILEDKPKMMKQARSVNFSSREKESGEPSQSWSSLKSFLLVTCASMAFLSSNVHMIITRDIEQLGGMLALNIGPGPENFIVDYVRGILLLVGLTLMWYWVENAVNSYAVATEQIINERRSSSPRERPKSPQFFVVDLMLVRFLLIFFPSVRVQRLSFPQAVRAATLQKNIRKHESGSLKAGVHLLAFHQGLEKSNAPLTLAVIHSSSFVIILVLSTLGTLTLEPRWTSFLSSILSAACIVRLFAPFASATNVIVADLMARSGAAMSSDDSIGDSVVAKGVQVGLWFFTVLAVLSALGFDMSSYLTGLGISSIAAAFAAQTTLKEIFSTASLLGDQPFHVGDHVVFRGIEAIVRRIGFRSTHLTTIYNGEDMVVPNSDLTSGIILNRTKMTTRRVKSRLFLSHENSAEQVDKVQEIVEQTVSRTANTTFVYCHLMEISLDGMVFEYVFLVNSNVGQVFKDAQHEINLGLLHAFQQHNIQWSVRKNCR